MKSLAHSCGQGLGVPRGQVTPGGAPSQRGVRRREEAATEDAHVGEQSGQSHMAWSAVEKNRPREPHGSSDNPVGSVRHGCNLHIPTDGEGYTILELVGRAWSLPLARQAANGRTGNYILTTTYYYLLQPTTTYHYFPYHYLLLLGTTWCYLVLLNAT